MKEYALYATKNIFQIRESQLDAKLDKDLQNFTKNHVIEMEILDNENTDADDRKANIKEKSKENINC